MKLDVDCHVDLGDLMRFVKDLPEAVDAGVRKAAFAVQRKAQDRVPVDTGALKASIFAVTSKSHGGPAAVSAAKARRKGAQAAEGIPPKARPMSAYVVCGVEYGMYIEYGTMHRRGNVARVGSRSGRIGVRVRAGETPHYSPGIYTLRPGYLFMADAAEWGRRQAPEFVRAELRRRGAVD